MFTGSRKEKRTRRKSRHHGEKTASGIEKRTPQVQKARHFSGRKVHQKSCERSPQNFPLKKTFPASASCSAQMCESSPPLPLHRPSTPLLRDKKVHASQRKSKARKLEKSSVAETAPLMQVYHAHSKHLLHRLQRSAWRQSPAPCSTVPHAQSHTRQPFHPLAHSCPRDSYRESQRGGAYFARARIFLLLRCRQRVRFFFHFQRILAVDFLNWHPCPMVAVSGGGD